MKYCEFVSNIDSQKTFGTLKQNITEAPILRGPIQSLPFHISTNASDTTLGDFLGQKYSTPYFVYYTSKNLTPPELNYTIT